MSELEMVEALCVLIEKQAALIRHLSVQLTEARELTEAERGMIEAAKCASKELAGF